MPMAHMTEYAADIAIRTIILTHRILASNARMDNTVAVVPTVAAIARTSHQMRRHAHTVQQAAEATTAVIPTAAATADIRGMAAVALILFPS
jgi:hypothetical protein